jgi:hypothetical protein
VSTGVKNGAIKEEEEEGYQVIRREQKKQRTIKVKNAANKNVKEVQ